MEKFKIQAGLKPVIDIAGTAFYVELSERVFRQVDSAANTINMHEVTNPGTGIITFAFDTQTKNTYSEILRPGEIPEHVKLVVLPGLDELTAQYNKLKDAVNDRLSTAIEQSSALRKRTRINRKSIH
jgi:hypothetical protein